MFLFYNFFTIQFRAKVDYFQLTGHGPIEGITWKDFAKHELNGITSGALAGWRKDEGDWKMRFRNAVWGGLRGGLKVVADDAYEYAKDR